jgi:polysaccharide deacetylase family protein (PEP-CTERM system associated)
MHNSGKSFLFTVDVEDWFQVENFKASIPFDSWADRELRVERNTHRILDLLDEVKKESEVRIQNPEANTRKVCGHNDNFDPNDPNEPNQQTNQLQKPEARSQESGANAPNVQNDPNEPNQSNQQTNKTVANEISNRNERSEFHRANSTAVHATFFVLGWIARRCPDLIRQIHERGHEVASHGVNHNLCTAEDAKSLTADLAGSKALLEDITGSEVVGYRAPSFSVSDDILKRIEDAGYHYDSSYNSFDKHGRYGRLSLDGKPKQGIAYRMSGQFFELPVSNLTIQPIAYSRKPIVFPFGGGGYFRLIPYFLFKRGIRRILSKDRAYSFYLHPWEVDPDQPRVDDAPASFKFRHYVNLAATAGKIRRMLNDFSGCRFVTCREYV